MKNTITLIIAGILIVGAILFLQSYSNSPQGDGGQVVEVVSNRPGMDIEKKAMMFERAKEITTPNGFINTDGITIDELVGKKVILVDFWTYSCINCQRTTPYLNAWYDKYADDGLEIIGMHTPEFEFEKELSNVQQAVEKFKIKYPVVLDNDFSTWRAYQNRFWPRKYLIDIDGFIVYDHIGEGGYEETEKKIQELLKERADRLKLDQEIDSDIADIEEETRNTASTPEIYFGASRNELLGNGQAHRRGKQTFTLPEKLRDNLLYLEGEWEIFEEYAESKSPNAKILLPYEASNVFTVASADQSVDVTITRDGNSLNDAAGSDTIFTEGKDHIVVQQNQLYRLIESEKSGKYLLEMSVSDPGFKIYTFTFG